MTNKQWQLLLDIIQGKQLDITPVGFIIDSPWIPGWAGISTLDYFTSEQLWFEANLKAVREFPEVLFLPGFWSEYGMCTEPSAFGAKCTWHENELPFADKIIHSMEDIDRLNCPDPHKDGLAPFVLKRLGRYRKSIEAEGHAVRFAVARGPLNVASFLMGTTEFLIGLRTEPEKIHKLLSVITEYLCRWLQVQKAAFDSIDGIFILDDIVGFCGETDFLEFAKPYLLQIFNAFPAAVNFFHNDADGRVCAHYLSEIGINMFNFSFLHTLPEMKEWTRNQVVLVGNLPPRDTLALGSPEEVFRQVQDMANSVSDKTRILLSAGGGMPDGVRSENITAFLKAVDRKKVNVLSGADVK
ncbi:MAG: uroporphyrinogen decarboxylase family protein [Anaerohalosphaeraceae bacterium]